MENKTSIREFICPTCKEKFVMTHDESASKEQVQEFEDRLCTHALYCAMRFAMSKI